MANTRFSSLTTSNPLEALNQVRFVLSHPTHPGNIGAAARALKTMGASQLALINPKDYPSEVAVRRASGAQDVLQNTQVYTSLEEAIADCRVVIGTTARKRSLDWPGLTPREMAEQLASDKLALPIAIVFGTENSGLTNEELQACQYHLTIPTNETYSSLNLASAVQLIAYELRVALLQQAEQSNDEESSFSQKDSRTEESGELPATAAELQQLIQHIEQIFTGSGYLHASKLHMTRLRLGRLLSKSLLTESDVRLLRGALASIEKFRT